MIIGTNANNFFQDNQNAINYICRNFEIEREIQEKL